MILLYTPKVNNRLRYIAKTILSDICGFDFKVTQSSEEFLNFKGARISYSDKDFPGPAVTIYPAGFLFEKGVKDFVPPIKIIDGLPPHLFPNQQNDTACSLGYDLFSASFYMISRYEEYLPFLEDRHGRFEADQSFAYQKGFLDLPIVDIYARELKNKILELFPYIEHQQKSFSFIPTYDIDVAYAFKGKGLARTVLLAIKDILTLNIKGLINRFDVIYGTKKDPFDTYDLQLQWQKQYQLNPIYFIHSGDFGPKDRNISIHSRAFQNLVKMIGDYAQTGIHPSYASNYSTNKLEKELSFLSGTLNRTIENSRQHYLKLKLPNTYQNLIKLNIKNDFTMGYASHIGFRAGTCSPFYFYDLSLESETRLRIYPLSIMDGTLRDYMKLKPADALQIAQKILNSVKELNGTFICLFHNDALSDNNDWKGWKNVYLEIIKAAIKKSPEK